VARSQCLFPAKQLVLRIVYSSATISELGASREPYQPASGDNVE